jgi:hypothetical protein
MTIKQYVNSPVIVPWTNNKELVVRGVELANVVKDLIKGRDVSYNNKLIINVKFGNTTVICNSRKMTRILEFIIGKFSVTECDMVELPVGNLIKPRFKGIDDTFHYWVAFHGTCFLSYSNADFLYAFLDCVARVISNKHVVAHNILCEFTLKDHDITVLHSYINNDIEKFGVILSEEFMFTNYSEYKFIFVRRPDSHVKISLLFSLSFS